jgi:hypothetical protein
MEKEPFRVHDAEVPFPLMIAPKRHIPFREQRSTNKLGRGSDPLQHVWKPSSPNRLFTTANTIREK